MGKWASDHLLFLLLWSNYAFEVNFQSGNIVKTMTKGVWLICKTSQQSWKELCSLWPDMSASGHDDKFMIISEFIAIMQLSIENFPSLIVGTTLKLTKKIWDTFLFLISFYFPFLFISFSGCRTLKLNAYNGSLLHSNSQHVCIHHLPLYD